MPSAAPFRLHALAGVSGATRPACGEIRLRPLLSAMLLAGALPVLAVSDMQAHAAVGTPPREGGGAITAGAAPGTAESAVAARDAGARAQSGAITVAQASPAPATSGAVDAGSSNAAVVGEEEFLPADELEPDVPAATRPQPGAAPAAAGTRGKGNSWGLAPVRWGGVLSAGFRYRSFDASPSSSDQIYEGRIRASSYLIEPWIALVSGDVALTMLRNQQAGDGTTASSNLAGTSITGNGSLSLFPQSRFPFQASLAVADSRTDDSLANSNTSRKRLSLRQDYRPPVGNWSSFAGYDRSELTGGFGRDTVDVLGGGFSASAGSHSVSGNGTLSRNESSDGSSSDRIALLRHGYRFSEVASLETTATYIGQETDFDGQGLTLSGDTRSAQIFSFATWNPLDSPWRATANARYFQSESNLNNNSFESRNLGGSASLTYQASRNLGLFGTFNANSSTGNQGRNLSTSQTLGLNYSGDPRMFGEYAYSWFGSGAFTNASSSEGAAQRAASMSLGHSLQRSWQPNELSVLSGSVSQSVSTSHATGLESVSSTNLSHTASITLQATPSDALSGFLSASASDNRVSGDETSSFQLLNVQLSGRWRVNALSEFNSNLTWQIASQEASRRDEFGVVVDTATQSGSLSGNLGYNHIRAFGIRGLRYSADFRANTNASDSRRAGDPDAGRERITLDLDQRLRYRIGRLDAELQARIAEVEGRRNGLIFFKVSRSFGAY